MVLPYLVLYQLGRTEAFIGDTPQSPTKQWEERFSYDLLARLDVASEYRGDNSSLSWQTDYDYDPYGNRTSVSGIGTASFTTYYNTATNRITTAGMSYDAAWLVA